MGGGRGKGLRSNVKVLKRETYKWGNQKDDKKKKKKMKKKEKKKEKREGEVGVALQDIWRWGEIVTSYAIRAGRTSICIQDVCLSGQ